ncbi:MAG: flippase [Anaerolineales bacterium]
MGKLARDSLLSVVFYLAPRFANVILFVLIGRQAGPAQAGIVALANSYLILATTAMRGLDELIVRQVAREPQYASRYLVNFTVVRLAASIVIFGLLALAVRVMFSYTEAVAVPVLLFSLSLLPDGVTYVAQAVLMGQRQFAAAAVVLAATSILKLAGAAGVVALGQGLAVMAGVWLLGSCLGAAALLLIALRGAGGLHKADLTDWHLVRDNWRPAGSLLFITTLLAFESQTDTLVLSKYHTEAQVGWYNGATTLAYSLLVLSQAYRLAVYPLMTRYALDSKEKLAELYRQSLRYIAILALPMSAGLLVLGPQLVRFAFGSDFAPAALPLQILSLALLFLFLNEPSARMMLVADRQRPLSIFLISSTAVNIMLNFILTPPFGPTGAALARVASTCVFSLLIFAYVTKNLTAARISSSLVYSVLATVAMAVLVTVVRSWPLLISMSIGILSYVIILLLLDHVLFNQLRMALRVSIKQLRSR